MMVRGEMGIYMITCIPTGKIYIGSSVNLGHRWISHQSDLNLNQHGNSYLQKAWNKYGAENFKCEVLQPIRNVENLRVIEEGWIRLKNSTNKDVGFNLTDQCVNPPLTGRHHSPESKAKISRKGKGRKLSEITRQRMSESRKGRSIPREVVEKMIATRKANGYKPSPEHIEKLRIANIGRPAWNKGLPRELNPLTGRVVDKEVKHRISLKNQGRFWGQGEKSKKPVSAYNDDGEKVLEFDCTTSAMKAGYNNISRAIKEKHKVGGLTWCYSNMNLEDYLAQPKSKVKRSLSRKPVVPFLDTETGIYYDNCRQLATAFNEDSAKMGRDIRKGKYGNRFLNLN